jgi:hypothetical protein
MTLQTFDLEPFNPETATQEIIFVSSIEWELRSLEWIDIETDGKILYSKNKAKLTKAINHLKKVAKEYCVGFPSEKENIALVDSLFSTKLIKKLD